MLPTAEQQTYKQNQQQELNSAGGRYQKAEGMCNNAQIIVALGQMSQRTGGEKERKEGKRAIGGKKNEQQNSAHNQVRDEHDLDGQTVVTVKCATVHVLLLSVDRYIQCFS